ncbi:MAG: YhcH/YjgK/YiaL family protein [Bacteriovoracaceae bacterium]|jgi:biofilm protein TabA
MIYDKVKNFQQYPFGTIWVQAFEFLQSVDEKSVEKRYDLGNGMFAIIMSYPTKNHSQAVLETHEKYLDIQMTISGAEGIEYFHRDDLEISEKYCEKKDVQFYKYPGKPKAITSNVENYFTALWPEDAHMPQLKINEYHEVKKVVVKIPVKLL